MPDTRMVCETDSIITFTWPAIDRVGCCRGEHSDRGGGEISPSVGVAGRYLVSGEAQSGTTCGAAKMRNVGNLPPSARA